MAVRPFWQEGLILVLYFFVGLTAAYLLGLQFWRGDAFARLYSGLLGFAGGLAALWYAWLNYLKRLRARA
jgi:hypothetical protein